MVIKRLKHAEKCLKDNCVSIGRQTNRNPRVSILLPSIRALATDGHGIRSGKNVFFNYKCFTHLDNVQQL